MAERLVDTAPTDSDGETRVTWHGDIKRVGVLIVEQFGDDAFASLTIAQARTLAKRINYAADKAENA